MRARKGEAWGVFVLVLVGFTIGEVIGSFAWMGCDKRRYARNGYFEVSEKVYKVTEYSKLEYPEKGPEQ